MDVLLLDGQSQALIESTLSTLIRRHHGLREGYTSEIMALIMQLVLPLDVFVNFT